MRRVKAILGKVQRQNGGGGLAAQSCCDSCNPKDCTRQAPLSMEFPRQDY